MGKKGTIEHEKLYNKIHSTYGSNRFISTVTKYIEQYGVPDDPSALLLILDTKEQNIICSGIEKLKEIYGGLTKRQQEDIRRKLSILAMTDKSREVRGIAGEVLEGMKE
jgi:ssDNA-specific exonuclease RecJ